jgi:uncharacterized protein with von Willebrand factor type A (vWA) domain
VPHRSCWRSGHHTCTRGFQGILINTFMLASDYGLINFVQKVTEL